MHRNHGAVRTQPALRYRAPGAAYLQWLEAVGFDRTYAFHKRFLQFLQASRPERWVLKSPDHLFAFGALRRTYPDARFVILHRDPVAVLPSVARLTEVLRRPFVRRLDCLDIGRQVAERWRDGLQRLLTLDRQGALPSSRVLHLRYEEITRDPMAAVAAIDHHSQYRLGSDAQARMLAPIQAKPRGGYGQNRYDPGRYGYEGMESDPLIDEYCEYFGLRGGPSSASIASARYRGEAINVPRLRNRSRRC